MFCCIVFLVVESIICDGYKKFYASENIAQWDMEETKQGGPFPDILDFDIFVNCIFLSEVRIFICLLGYKFSYTLSLCQLSIVKSFYFTIGYAFFTARNSTART